MKIVRSVSVSASEKMVALQDTPAVESAPQAWPLVRSAKGYLSGSQARALVKRLRNGSRPSALLSEQLVVEESVSGSPLVIGNDVHLLTTGPQTYDAMLDAIGKAQQAIYLESYILEDDAIGKKFAEALKERSRKGVTVALMVDSVGSLSTPDEYFDDLRNAGVQVVIFNPINPLKARMGWRPNQRNHRKVLVVDGKVGFTGGFNLSAVYSSSSPGRSGKVRRKVDADKAPWRDTHVRIRGPAALELEREFLEGWGQQGGTPLPPRIELVGNTVSAGSDVVRIVSSEPDDVSAIYLTFLSAISRSQRSVHITMAYFVPDEAFINVLKDAASRGVDVRLILPGFSDFWMVFQAGRSHYNELLESNVRIYERRESLLHAKTAVIDGVWSTVGSSNIDWRSFVHNHELNAVVFGTSFGKEMEDLFERDCKNSTQVTLDEWQQRPWTLHVKETIASLFSYWL